MRDYVLELPLMCDISLGEHMGRSFLDELYDIGHLGFLQSTLDITVEKLDPIT